MVRRIGPDEQHLIDDENKLEFCWTCLMVTGMLVIVIFFLGYFL